jgi:hypothetical protein
MKPPVLIPLVKPNRKIFRKANQSYVKIFIIIIKIFTSSAIRIKVAKNPNLNNRINYYLYK